MFFFIMNYDSVKVVKFYNLLVSVVKLNFCEVDVRIIVMKLLFRLWLDWLNCVYVINDLDMSCFVVMFGRIEEVLFCK